jgi:PTH1 family peptidyl-tRNA hydrolase
MLLFAGLGNPGAKYANNRHNVGFMAADAIARRHSFSPWSRKFQAEIAEGKLAGEKVILIKPQTFMNLSGQSVGEAMRFHKLDASAVTAFYDEIDLASGKVRVKTGGGAGGHNGIRSLDQHIGKDYRRVRIGVGHPGIKELVHGHYRRFAKADQEWLEPLLEAKRPAPGAGERRLSFTTAATPRCAILVPTADDDRLPAKRRRLEPHPSGATAGPSSSVPQSARWPPC